MSIQTAVIALFINLGLILFVAPDRCIAQSYQTAIIVSIVFLVIALLNRKRASNAC